ncbi:MAG TPA: DNA polymerase IV [Planctomycetota bacterium]|jgi:DNA polymerase-4|nr:DNA polymerase IV [Planctomycetota bacterium]
MAGARPSILHVDMDAFYASVEVRDNPSLAGLPVCVGGPASGRGVIAAASYEARAFGVHSAMPTARARRLCPNMVLLPPDFDRYTAASRRIMEIFRSFTPQVEPLSLDEAFLDVRGCERLHGSAVDIGHAIRARILKETALVASVGIAPSKFLAKLASDLDKPDGFRVIEEHEIRKILDPLPVEKIFGVGERTAKRLHQLGVETVGDLAQLERGEVVRRFGASGVWIHDLAHGIDPRRVNPHREEKSHGMERTFAEDISDPEELRTLLLSFCEEVGFGLRGRGLRGRTVTLKVRYSDFKTLTRTRTLELPTNLGPRLFAVAGELFERVPSGPLRLLGVQVSQLEDVRQPLQGDLFESQLAPTRSRDEWIQTSERLEQATRSMDKLRRKYGRLAVQPASLLGRPPLSGRSAPREALEPDKPRTAADSASEESG